MYSETGETGETYDLEMYSIERIWFGSTVGVIKEGDPYLGKLGRVVDVTASGKSSAIAYQIDFGNSDIRSYSENELTPMLSSKGAMPDRLAATMSKPEDYKDPLRCQHENRTCSSLGNQYCPKGCELWLCAHHYREHGRSCPVNEGLDFILGNRDMILPREISMGL